ncbi:CAP domain-containing protein [Stenomitos frigidus ULC18]|uniref:CAP domain-containing protein n=2 Tax=Stenomitos TaxID=1844270 RepID=A0A2T1EGW9_9CYAN|nr:CAP domain-containing protein [Stenomitos frigidus ULC18]
MFKISAVGVMAIASSLGCAVVAPGSSLAATVPAPTLQKKLAQTPASLQTLEQTVLTQINQHRASRKLPPLTLNETISEQARNHSQAMASGKVPFSHNGFQQRVTTIGRTIPYSRAAENVAYNQGYSDPVSQAVQGWLQSTGHRQNIEGSFDLTGIGVAQNAKGEYYFTQIFIRRR